MIGESERGGCVLAQNDDEACVKVREYYERFLDGNFDVTVWLEDGAPSDVLEVYP
jgi:hypothetical protein